MNVFFLRTGVCGLDLGTIQFQGKGGASTWPTGSPHLLIQTIPIQGSRPVWRKKPARAGPC